MNVSRRPECGSPRRAARAGLWTRLGRAGQVPEASLRRCGFKVGVREHSARGY